MIKTIKVMLVPNNKQNTRLFQFAGASRFAYNWALAKEEENYKSGNKFVSDYDLRREFTVFKKQAGNEWLENVSNNVTKQAIKDACIAYKNFFQGKAKHPKFKSKKKSRPSFFQDNIKISFTDTHVKLEKLTLSRKENKQKLNYVRLAEHGRIPTDCKYYNPRITYDGLNWYISVGIGTEKQKQKLSDRGVGIDLGIKDLAICSDGNTYRNINKTEKVRKLEKQKKRLQRSVSRKYENNKKGVCYCKTNNIKKLEKKLLKVIHRLTNIRKDYLHKVITDIISRKPMFICLEDLNVNGMMKNRHLSKAVQQQTFHEFKRQIEYKSEWNGIQAIIADRFFPSSKMCSCCGCIKKDLKLSDRIYKCDCGNIIDRDFQASINLERYGLKEYIA